MPPSEMWMSSGRGPSGVWTIPPAMTSRVEDACDSVKFQVCDAKKRRVGDAGAANVFLAPFAAVEDDDEVDHMHSRVREHVRRAQRVATGRDDVLDHCDLVARLEPPLDLLGSPVSLRFFADQDERQAGLHGDRAAQKHGTELGSSQPLRLRWHQLCEMLAKPAQK